VQFDAEREVATVVGSCSGRSDRQASSGQDGRRRCVRPCTERNQARTSAGSPLTVPLESVPAPELHQGGLHHAACHSFVTLLLLSISHRIADTAPGNVLPGGARFPLLESHRRSRVCCSRRTWHFLRESRGTSPLGNRTRRSAMRSGFVGVIFAPDRPLPLWPAPAVRWRSWPRDPFKSSRLADQFPVFVGRCRLAAEQAGESRAIMNISRLLWRRSSLFGYFHGVLPCRPGYADPSSCEGGHIGVGGRRADADDRLGSICEIWSTIRNSDASCPGVAHHYRNQRAADVEAAGRRGPASYTASWGCR